MGRRVLAAGGYSLQAATLAFGCGLITSYLLSITWVFQERRWPSPVGEVGLFVLIGGIGLLGNGLWMWLLTEYAHLHYLYAKMGAALALHAAGVSAQDVPTPRPHERKE